MQTFPKEHKSLLNVSVMKLWTMQIAKGMVYLESKNLVHRFVTKICWNFKCYILIHIHWYCLINLRDLASRNILVASLNQVNKDSIFYETHETDFNFIKTRWK